jgi:hypothetical protein
MIGDRKQTNVPNCQWLTPVIITQEAEEIRRIKEV